MHFFSVDGPLFKFMRTLLDVLIINFCWLLCSIPIFTIGPSTVAAFSVTLKMIDESEGYVGRQFFKEFKKNFKNGLPLGILFLIALYAMYLDIQLVIVAENPFMFLAITLVSGYIFIALFLYAFALSARYVNNFINTMKNSYQIFMRHFLRTLCILVVVAVEIVVFTFNTTMIFFLILIGPTSIILTISGMSLPIFREIEREDETFVKKVDDKPDAIFKDHPESDSITAKANMNYRNK